MNELVATSSEYSVYQNVQGKEIVVIQGLDINQPIEHSVTQQWVSGHYSVFQTMYIVLFIVTLVVVIYRGVYRTHFSPKK